MTEQSFADKIISLGDVIINHDIATLKEMLPLVDKGVRFYHVRALELSMDHQFVDGARFVMQSLRQTTTPEECGAIVNDLIVSNAWSTNVDIVVLISEGVKVSHSSWQQCLTNCLTSGNLAVAQHVINTHASPSPFDLEEGLYQAAKNGHTNVVRWGIQTNVPMDVVSMAMRILPTTDEMSDVLFDHANDEQRHEVAMAAIEQEFTPQTFRWLHRYTMEKNHHQLTEHVRDTLGNQSINCRKKM